jgi:membrane protein DedA with SNARE-associated domain
MFRLLLGAAIGYVLGSRAGRERYEQIKRWTSRAADHPAVQGAAGFVQAKVGELLPGGKK